MLIRLWLTRRMNRSFSPVMAEIASFYARKDRQKPKMIIIKRTIAFDATEVAEVFIFRGICSLISFHGMV
jgi:hypothetical protein